MAARRSELGRRLKSYREGFSEERLTRKEMEQRLSSKGVKYGREAIKKLEEGFYGSVDRDVLLAIFQELQVSPQKFFRAQGLYVVSE